MRSENPDAVAHDNQQRYSEKELGLIFKRAAELQEEVGASASSGARASSGFTLAEIQQIASDVGIAPRQARA
ncbi:MAG: hypothetical protein ABJB66_19550, partial [Gemmatimonadaceae bacterium]